MSNAKSQGKLLPAAMVSLTLVNLPGTPGVAGVAASTADQDGGHERLSRVPVVMQFEPNTKGLEPSVLRDFVRKLSEKTGYVAMMNDDLEPEGQCGSISGSDQGWDDSKFDC